MRQPSELRTYQVQAIQHQIFHPLSMLWLDMGLGKTAVTLSTIDYRMRIGQVKKTLIFGPLRVVHSVWAEEAQKWEHLRHLRFQIIHGTVAKRERQFFNDADIYLTNYANVNWLAEMLDHYYLKRNLNIPFQMVVYDEVTQVKNSTSQRVSGGTKVVNKGTPEEHSEKVIGWRKMVPHFQFRTGMTGTPSPNGYKDLFGQFLVVDDGERLGSFVTHFRHNYLTQGYNGYGYTISDHSRKLIHDRISDITIEMSAKDHLDMPDVTYNDVLIQLDRKTREKYAVLEEEFFVELDTASVEVFNKASLYNKLLQFCNGFPYLSPDEPKYEVVHQHKLDALASVLEEAGGSPVLVGYSFRSDADEIEKRFKKYRPVNLTKTPPGKLPSVLRDIQAGKHELIIGHPASMGHGIDGLQHVCHTAVWFGLTWNLEYYEQFCGRINRQGQTKPVVIHRLLVQSSLDEVVSEALKGKEGDQANLRKAINAYRQKHRVAMD